MAKVVGKGKSIFVLIDNDAEEKIVGYFKDAQAAMDAVERNAILEALILEVVSAFDVIPPDEPQYELVEKDLCEMVANG